MDPMNPGMPGSVPPPPPPAGGVPPPPPPGGPLGGPEGQAPHEEVLEVLARIEKKLDEIKAKLGA